MDGCLVALRFPLSPCFGPLKLVSAMLPSFPIGRAKLFWTETVLGGGEVWTYFLVNS